MNLRKDLIYREIDGVIFDTANGELHELNESANDIISAFTKTHNQNEVINILQNKYSQSSTEEIKESIKELFSLFKNRGLLDE